MFTKEKMTCTYSLNELRVREYIRLLMDSLAKTVDDILHKRYEKFVDVEKIRFTNTKSYRKKQQRNQKESRIDDLSAKLDYWVPVSDSRTNNDPHITYSSYDGGGKVFDLNAHLDGFHPSMTEQEYYNDQLGKLFDILNVNDVINMFYEYEYNRELWETVSCFNDFCHNHIQDCSTVVAQSLQEFDKYFNLKQTSRSSIETKSHFLVSPEKIEATFLRGNFFCKEDLPEITDECEVDVLVLNTNQKSHFIIYTRIYPIHKALIGKRVGDTFVLPNISNTYKILRIY